MFKYPQSIDFLAIARICLLTTTFLPFLYTASVIYPFVIPRTLFFECIVTLSLAASIGAFLRGQIEIRFTHLTVLLGTLVTLGVIATLFSTNPLLSLMSTPDRMEGLVLWIFIFIFSILIQNTFDTKTWKRWVILNLSVGALVALMGLSQHAGNFSLNDQEGRVDIFFGNPVFYAAYILSIFAITLYTLTASRTALMKYVIGTLVVLLLTALVLSGTRSVLLGIVSGFIMSLFIFFKKSPDKKRALFAITTSLAVLVFIISTLVILEKNNFIESKLFERFSVITEGDIRTQARYHLYKAATEGIYQNPILGYGFEGYTSVFEKHIDPHYYGDILSSTPEPWSDRAHNQYLDFAVNIGIFGTILFVGIFVLLFKLILHSRHETLPRRLVLIGALVAYAVHLLFNFSVLTDLLFFAALIGYMANHENVLLTLSSQKMHRNTSSIVLAVTFIFCIITFSMVWDRSKFAHAIQEIMRTTEIHSFKRYEHLVVLGLSSHIDAPFAREHALVEGIKYMRTTENEDRLTKMVAHGRDMETAARNYGPLTPRDLYYYGMFYRIGGALNDASRVLEEGLSIAPKRLHILNALSMTYSEKGEYQKSLDIAEKAYNSESTYDESIIRYASALVTANQITQSDELLLEVYGSTEVFSLELIEAYKTVGLYERAATLLETNLSNNPKNIPYWELLITLYEEQNNNDAVTRAKKRMRAAMEATR